MKRVGKSDLDTAYEYIKNNCAALYKYRFEYHFLSGDPGKVIEELKRYQNDDGGFGHGLEPDFLLPESSPMATTIAFQIMDEIGAADDDLIRKAVHYYESTYDEHRLGWLTVSKHVNDYPHAPWWHYDEADGCTVLDKSWGNPSSEIIGTLYTFRQYLQTLDLERLLDHAIAYLNGLDEFRSAHEIYCFLRMYEKLPREYQKLMRDKISDAIKSLVCLDEKQWSSYVPKPLDFVQSRRSPLFMEIASYAERNCDYYIETMERGVWLPNWEWGQFETDWERSKKNWTGNLTIKRYRILREFNRMV